MVKDLSLHAASFTEKRLVDVDEHYHINRQDTVKYISPSFLMERHNSASFGAKLVLMVKTLISKSAIIRIRRIAAYSCNDLARVLLRIDKGRNKKPSLPR